MDQYYSKPTILYFNKNHFKNIECHERGCLIICCLNFILYNNFFQNITTYRYHFPKNILISMDVETYSYFKNNYFIDIWEALGKHI